MKAISLKHQIIRLVYLLLFLSSLPLVGQDCPLGDVGLNSQSDIDSFAILYPNCTIINGQLLVEEEDGEKIVNLDGLAKIKDIQKNLVIHNNSNLKSLRGLDQLTHVAGAVTINRNDSLIDLSGLNSLTEIDLYLDIGHNTSLISLNGLNNLQTIGLSLNLAGNSKLTNLKGLDNLSALGSYLSFYVNEALINFEGLEGLTTINSYLFVVDNDALENPKGLENVTSIDGPLTFFDNEKLNSLTAFRNLQSINGALSIWSNPNLSSLEGLENIKASSISRLRLTQSPQLSICGIQSICEYLNLSNRITEVDSNMVGCNTKQEIINSCMITSLRKEQSEAVFQLSPNPTSGLVTLDGINQKHYTIQVFDATGKLVLQQSNSSSIDLSNVPKGLYWLVVNKGNQIITKRLIRQ